MCAPSHVHLCNPTLHDPRRFQKREDAFHDASAKGIRDKPLLRQTSIYHPSLTVVGRVLVPAAGNPSDPVCGVQSAAH